MAASSEPPTSIDSYTQQNLSALLRALIWLTLLATIGYVVFSPIDPSILVYRLIITIPLIGALLIAFWLTQRQLTHQASILVIAAIWLVLMSSAMISGGILAPAFAALPVVVVITGILLNRRAMWTVVFLSISAGVLFVWFADVLPPVPIPHSPLSWLVAYIIYLSLTAYTIDRVVRHFHQSLQNTDKELAERKSIEQQLRFSEEKLARLFESAPFAMLIVRLSDDLIINANAACREFFELSSDQIIKQPVGALIQSQLPAQWPTIKETIQTIGTISGFEFSFRRHDNTLGFAQLSAEIVELADEMCTVVALQDVTPLRRANERLADLAARQEQLAILAQEALANSNLNTLFTIVAERTAQILNLRGLELIELDIDGSARTRTRWGDIPLEPPPTDLFRNLPHDQLSWVQLPAQLTEVVDADIHGVGLPLRGQERLFGLMLTYARSKLDLETIFFLRSVANILAVAMERFNTEQERRQIETQMLQAQKLESLGLLAGGIAHDFNNLLTGIMGHTSLALLDLPPNHELQPHLTAIDQASQRAAELCNQLLAYAGRGQRSREPVDLSALVREMGSILRLPASRSGQVTISYDLAPNLPAVVVEATQIRQVVLNLLTNAIEALGERGGAVVLRTGTVTLSAADVRRLNLMPAVAPGQYVTISVSDTGIGMNEATLRRIFDPFFSTKPKGHGLGLAAVQGIVRRHQGAIQVESTPGIGSTFTVYLPAAPITTPVPTVARTRPIILNGTALIVDDEATVRATVSRILERAGMETFEAATGHDALSLLTGSAISFNVALVDLAMPGMTGIELLKNIRRQFPQLPVLLMSGNAEQITTGPLPIDTYTDFLPKPYRTHDLLEKLQTLMQRAATPRLSPT